MFITYITVAGDFSMASVTPGTMKFGIILVYRSPGPITMKSLFKIASMTGG